MAWLMKGSALSRFSMFWGAMFMPPAVTMRSFLRSVMKRKPSSSKRPMSPVANQPSGRKTSRVASAEDLAVRRDLHLDAGHGLAHRAELEGVFAIVGEDGARLREAVALEDEDARGVKELGDVAREGRATRDGEPQATAQSRVHLREHELVGDRVLHAQPGRHGSSGLLEARDLLAHADGPPEDLPLEGRASVGLGESARVDLLEHARDAADEVRASLGQVLAQLVDALREGRAEPAVHPYE